MPRLLKVTRTPSEPTVELRTRDGQARRLTGLVYVGQRAFGRRTLPVWLAESPVPYEEVVSWSLRGVADQAHVELCYCAHTGGEHG
jgi:hypothetical protein